MSGKRKYSGPMSGFNKTRVIGGAVLRYRKAAPVAGSYRSRLVASSMPFKSSGPSRARTGGFATAAMGGNELNFLDTYAVSQPVDTTGVVTLLNGMQVGSSAQTRLGRKINIKSITGNFTVIPGATNTASQAKFIIVYDAQTNGVAPTWQDIFDNSTALGANSVIAQRNMSNIDRFKIIWSTGLFDITGNSTSAANLTDDSCHTFTMHKKCDLWTQFNAGNAGTVADIQTGSLYFLSLGTTAAASGITHTLCIRIRYTA